MGDKMHRDVQPQTSVKSAQETQPVAGAEKESVTAAAEPTVVIQNETVIRHGFPWKACLIALAALLLAAAAVLFAARKFGLFAPQQEETPQLTTISKASLQKIVEINELSAVEYIYNATAAKYDEASQEVQYYVAYKGVVSAGIDFKMLGIAVDDEDKKITLTLPPVEILDIRVDMGTMDYIFMDDKYETETISQEAYKLCKQDLQQRITKEAPLYETARENASASVEALFRPCIEMMNKEYRLVITYREAEE